jgi:hypothetical protein
MTTTNRRKTYFIALASTLAMMGLLVSPSFTGNAFAHAHLTLTPDIENVNPISVIVGHSNEPTFGVKPGVHDGIHSLEVSIEDANTALPLSGAQLKADKYYFRDFRSFERATSLERADQVETNITVGEVFGQPGHYLVRQIVQPGIYGYRIYGTIDYFGVGQVPFDATIFCTTPEGDTSKFNSGNWSGTFGCVDDIGDLYFPNEPRLIRSADSTDEGELQQVALPGGSTSASSAATNVAAQGGMALVPAMQILAVAATASVGGFFGFRAFRNRKKDPAL